MLINDPVVDINITDKSISQDTNENKTELKRNYESTEPTVVSHKMPLASVLQSVGPLRRSSSRSIKRPKFDDELVDSSGLKRSISRKTSESSPSEVKLKKTLTKQNSVQAAVKKKSKKIKPNPVPGDFGRWRPTDDLQLITSVTQTCDLQTIHLAVRFSCNFTLKEIQDRWFALLYDPLVSRLAQQSIKALPSDVIQQTMKNVLWSRDEDCILGDINIDDDTSKETFQKLLDEHLNVFHPSRNAESLKDHWLLLRHYHLLNCQTARGMNGVANTLADMEAKMVDEQIIGGEDDSLNQELTYTDRSHKREIRRLEREIPQWTVLIENSGHVDGLDLVDFSSDETLALLKGRTLKYSINKKKVSLGRCCIDFDVDIDLSVEGPAMKISRRQGILTYEDEGFFKLLNCGKRPFYINGVPLAFGASTTLMNNSVIEIYCIKLVFEINPNLFDVEAQIMKSPSKHTIQEALVNK